jgi:hypothetical protein
MNEKLCRNVRARDASASREFHIISDSYACDLCRRGYAIITIGLYCRIVAHLGRWLARRQVAPRQIRPPHVDGFLQHHLPRCHCTPPAVRNYSICRGALHGFLDFLRRERLIPDPPKRVHRLRAADRLLVELDQHLDRVQGLSALTRRARRRYAREFLEAQFGRRRLQLRAIRLRDLLRFVNGRALTLKRTSLHALVVGLRNFLRFLELTGRNSRSDRALAGPRKLEQHTSVRGSRSRHEGTRTESGHAAQNQDPSLSSRRPVVTVLGQSVIM